MIGRIMIPGPSSRTSSAPNSIYRVAASSPVVVRDEPSWDATVIGTLAPRSLLAVPDKPDEADFWHVGGSGWQGWVLAKQLSPALWATAQEPRFERWADLVGEQACLGHPSLCTH